MGKLLNLRSSVENKLPDPETLDYGRLAINFCSTTPAICWKKNDNTLAIVKPVNEWIGTQAEYDALETIDSNTTYYIVEE